MENLEHLKYPIGRFITPKEYSPENMKIWINTLKDFPNLLKQEVANLTITELLQTYRPDGWTIAQIVHHCADSHLNSFIRFKLALTENSPTIKPYEEQLWAELPDTKLLDIQVSLNLIETLHLRWTFLLENLSETDWDKEFIHPSTSESIKLKTNLAIYAWHCNHHLAHIQLAKNSKN